MKYFLLLVLAFFIGNEAYSQRIDYKIAAGGVAALPIGQRGSRADYGVGAELMFMKELQKGYEVGGSVGYTRYIVDQDLEDEGLFGDRELLPIALKGARSIGELGFGLALDLGYAISLIDGNDGGFLYEPKIYLETSRFITSLGYRGITQSGENLHAIQLGFAVKIIQ